MKSSYHISVASVPSSDNANWWTIYFVLSVTAFSMKTRIYTLNVLIINMSCIYGTINKIDFPVML